MGIEHLEKQNVRSSRLAGWLAAVGALALSLAAEAQFVQYTAPGTFLPRREASEQVLQRNMENARWKAGRLLLDPWLGIRNLAYVDNAGGRNESDLTAAAGAGLRAWLPVGSELTLALHALPEYVWWQDLSERNRWNGRYGVGLFGNLGRTGVELTLTRSEDAQFFSRELEDRVNTREDGAAARFEVDLGRGLGLFASGRVTSIDYLRTEGQALPDLAAIGRDESIGRAGVSYTTPRGITLGLGAEYSQAEFELGLADRSNSGTAPVALLEYQGSRLFVTADLAYRSLAADGSSRFVDYDDLTGRFQASLKVFGRLEPQLFGGRGLVYSFTDTWAYFEDTSAGVGLRLAITRWATARIFVETGEDRYTPFEPDGLRRSDDFESYGVDLSFELRRVSVRLGWWETDYQSSLPGFDRQTSGFSSGVSFGLGSGLAWE